MRFRKTLPDLVKRTRRKDMIFDLLKLNSALKVTYRIELHVDAVVGSRGNSNSKSHVLQLSQQSTEVFASSVSLHCSFSSLKLRAPFKCSICSHSSVLGEDATLLTVDFPHLRAWGDAIASDDNCRFVRSPCGRILLGLWQDGSVAGLLIGVHHVQVLKPFFGDSSRAAWELLAGKPDADDIDRSVGLHDYTVQLTLRGTRAECFQQTFYKIAALKGQAIALVQPAPSDFIVFQTHAQECRLGGGGSHKAKEQPATKVAQFEVVSAHKSGDRVAHTCTRPLQIAFRTPAFKSVIADLFFLDVTVFDEHGKVFWAVSSASTLSTTQPSCVSSNQVAAIDFDTPDVESGSVERWMHIADHGVAQLVVQLEDDASWLGGDNLAVLPRVKSAMWLLDVNFINAWFSSRYT